MSGAAAAAGVIIAQAIKASGAIVEVEPENFRSLLDKEERPLVVVSQGGTFKRSTNIWQASGVLFFMQNPQKCSSLKEAPR